MIKAVLFDVDGVLLDSLEAQADYYRRVLPRYGYSAPTTREVAAVYNLTFFDQVKALTGEKSGEKIYGVMASEGEIDSRLLRIPAHEKQVLESLRKNYLLGVVSSGGRDYIGAFIALAGISGLLDTVVVYEDTERHKPDPEPLLLAARRLGVGPGEAAYVGDFDTDVAAARAAGMVAVGIGGAVSDADFLISALSELADAIAKA